MGGLQEFRFWETTREKVGIVKESPNYLGGLETTFLPVFFLVDGLLPESRPSIRDSSVSAAMAGLKPTSGSTKTESSIRIMVKNGVASLT